MHRSLFLSRVVVPALLLLELSLGARGIFREDRDLMTMHPYGSPFMQCIVDASELPSQMYLHIPSGSFTSPVYLELLPLEQQALERFLRRTHPDAHLAIRCQELYGLPPHSYRFP